VKKEGDIGKGDPGQIKKAHEVRNKRQERGKFGKKPEGDET